VLKEDLEMQSGHRYKETITDIYAPFDPMTLIASRER